MGVQSCPIGMTAVKRLTLFQRDRPSSVVFVITSSRRGSRGGLGWKQLLMPLHDVEDACSISHTGLWCTLPTWIFCMSLRAASRRGRISRVRTQFHP